MTRRSGATQNERRRAEAVAFMARLQSDAASAEDWTSFTRWLEADPLNAAALDALGSLETAVETYRDAASRPAPRAPVPRRRPRWSLGWLIPAGAGAAVCAGIAAIALVLTSPHQSSVGPAAARPASIFVAADAARTITLGDGSRVWLNRNSRVTARISGEHRQVFLDPGSEAAFDVAHDARRPFTVFAGERQIEVTGTAFDVDRRANLLIVAVSRGSVLVADADGVEDHRLAAGQELEHRRGDARSKVRAVPADAVAGWRSGRLSFEDTSLAEVTADLARYFDRPIATSASAGRLRFTGVLVIDNQTAILKRLEAYLPVTAQIEADRIVLNSRGRP